MYDYCDLNRRIIMEALPSDNVDDIYLSSPSTEEELERHEEEIESFRILGEMLKYEISSSSDDD
jgi:hypothetical protein